MEWSWILLIAILTLIPSSQFQSFKWSDIFGLDKLAHLFVFMTMYVLHAMAERQEQNQKRIYKKYLWLGAGYGILLEIIQSISYLGRHFDVLDIIANIIGLMIGAILIYKLHK